MNKFIKAFVSLAVFAALLFLRSLCAGNDIWSENYEKWSAFIAQGSGEDKITLERVQAVFHEIEEQILQDGAESEGEDISLLSCASSYDEGVIKTDVNETSVKISVTSGDYFYFHQLDFVSGNAYSDDLLQHDTVVLDSLASFGLFGSVQTVGKYIIYDGVELLIVGVAKGEEGRMYLPYEMYEKAGHEFEVTCAEALIPDLLDGYAASVWENALMALSADMQLTKQSGRYLLISSFKRLWQWQSVGTRETGAAYPDWENANIVRQNRADALALLAAVSLFFEIWFTVSAFCGIFKRRGLAKAVTGHGGYRDGDKETGNSDW